METHTVQLNEMGLGLIQFLLNSLKESDSTYSQAIIFAQQPQLVWKNMMANREMLSVKRVYVVQSFQDIQDPRFLKQPSRIYFDNPYSYDPYNRAFKYGKWVKEIENRLDPTKPYRLIFCNQVSDRNKVSATYVPQSRPNILKRLL